MTHSNNEIEVPHEDIKKALILTTPHDLNIMECDVNAKLGNTETLKVVAGSFSLGEINSRGHLLILFYQEE